MSRTFIYARVSTSDQTTENQLREIQAAGFHIEEDKRKQRIVEECISGSVAATSRPKLSKLLERLESGDELVVTKLDRLGRNASDVTAMVDRLAKEGVTVVCLQLGKMDLTSPAGRMTMGVLNHVAQFERDLLIERTQAGLARVKAEGKTLGRKPALTTEQQREARQRLAKGASVSELAREFKTTRQTIMRVRAAAEVAA